MRKPRCVVGVRMGRIYVEVCGCSTQRSKNKNLWWCVPGFLYTVKRLLECRATDLSLGRGLRVNGAKDTSGMRVG